MTPATSIFSQLRAKYGMVRNNAEIAVKNDTLADPSRSSLNLFIIHPLRNIPRANGGIDVSPTEIYKHSHFKQPEKKKKKKKT